MELHVWYDCCQNPDRESFDIMELMKIKTLLTLILIYTGVSISHAQGQYAQDAGEVAFDGYDLVGFFDDQVIKGFAEFEVEYEGVKLRFSSEDNLRIFNDDPEAYLPAYGGWCAIALVGNAFVIPDYSLYKIQEGRLFFFQVKAFFNGLTYWNKDPDKNQVLADINYSKHFNE